MNRKEFRIAAVGLAVAVGLTTPARADGEHTSAASDFRVVAVRPVLGMSASGHVAVAVLGARYLHAQVPAVGMRAAMELATAPRGADGGGFSGASTASDVDALTVGFLLATLPVLEATDGESYEKARAAAGVLTSRATGLAPDVRAPIAEILGPHPGPFSVAPLARLFSAATVAIDGEAVRLHGYLTVGLWAGFCVVASTSGPDSQLADEGSVLADLLEQDAALAGSDRVVARRVRRITEELRASTPRADFVLAEVGRMLAAEPDGPAPGRQ